MSHSLLYPSLTPGFGSTRLLHRTPPKQKGSDNSDDDQRADDATATARMSDLDREFQEYEEQVRIVDIVDKVITK
jgi:hypothetical protein